jgi:type 1 glutamine amidotransferase
MVSLLAAIVAMPNALVVPNPHVLVFSKTTGFRHDSIPLAIAAIQKLGKDHGFQVDATEDSETFTDEKLKPYDLIIFASTTGDPLNDDQQKAMERFVESGKGWMGIHAASDTEYDWPWYAELVGAYFKSHPPGGQRVHVKIENRGNPGTIDLPRLWIRPDEWYDWRANPRGKVTVLASLDEGFYKNDPQDHPIAWCHWQGKGRAWYTEMGHFKEAYSEPEFVKHLYGGLMWAAQGSVKAKGAADIQWQTGNTRTALLNAQGSFEDCQLHAEFKLGAGKNATLLLPWGHGLEISNDNCGAVEGNRPKVNAFAGKDEWNTFDILYRAPRFRDGKKVQNACFIEVRLNGIIVQQNQEVTTDNQHAAKRISLSRDDSATSFRNTWVKKLSL